MDEPNTDVIQGTLDMLILKTLSLEPMHGFGIARRIEQISRGVFKVNPGSLLTALAAAGARRMARRRVAPDGELAPRASSTRSRAPAGSSSRSRPPTGRAASSAVARLLKAEG